MNNLALPEEKRSLSRGKPKVMMSMQEERFKSVGGGGLFSRKNKVLPMDMKHQRIINNLITYEGISIK